MQMRVSPLLTQALRGDYECIRLLGHRMKGVGGGYGFDAISDIGRSLERAVTEESPSIIRGLVVELSVYLNRVQVVFR